jgi:DNA polymerase III subunit beta
MKLIIKQKTLSSLLSKVAPLANQKSTMPILQNIRIEANSEKLMLTASDLDSYISSVIDCSIIECGATTVPAHTFNDIIKKTPNDRDIELTLDSDFLIVKSGRSKYKLPCLDANDFPSVPDRSFDLDFDIDSKTLITSIDKSLFAVSSDESRYYLTGVCFSARDNTLKISATDGNRISRSTHDIQVSDFSVIVPKKPSVEIKKLASSSSSVKLFISKSLIKVESENTTYISKLIDGQFPDLDRVVPSNNNLNVSFNRKNLVDCLERISISATDKSRSVKLSINKNKVELDTTNGHEELETDYQSEDITTGFNSSYLLDILRNLDNEYTTFSFKDGKSPLLISEASNEFVLMPIRI